ncbi:hypothetical protein HDU93_003709, partial [Gonapodya sp. JEL0774]
MLSELQEKEAAYHTIKLRHLGMESYRPNCGQACHPRSDLSSDLTTKHIAGDNMADYVKEDKSKLEQEAELSGNGGLKRGLKSRHLQMITLGGTI